MVNETKREKWQNNAPQKNSPERTVNMMDKANNKNFILEEHRTRNRFRYFKFKR